METVIQILLLAMMVYVGMGVLYSIYFLTKGIYRLDDSAEGSPWHFRLIIWPGVVLLWIVLFFKRKKSNHG